MIFYKHQHDHEHLPIKPSKDQRRQRIQAFNYTEPQPSQGEALLDDFFIRAVLGTGVVLLGTTGVLVWRRLAYLGTLYLALLERVWRFLDITELLLFLFVAVYVLLILLQRRASFSFTRFLTACSCDVALACSPCFMTWVRVDLMISLAIFLRSQPGHRNYQKGFSSSDSCLVYLETATASP